LFGSPAQKPHAGVCSGEVQEADEECAEQETDEGGADEAPLAPGVAKEVSPSALAVRLVESMTWIESSEPCAASYIYFFGCVPPTTPTLWGVDVMLGL
jgi:hypothetical protein